MKRQPKHNHNGNRPHARPEAPGAVEAAASLTPIERVRLARHPARPQTLDYIGALIGEFIEIHGDRRFADDGAIVAGLDRRAAARTHHDRANQAQLRQAASRGLPQGGAGL
jgi:acetyl-CoA carboxylase carboxyl transferase subunit alpha